MQSFREALLGCGLAKLLDPSIDIRRPYVEQGPNAFSGRGLDERVVNPFLHEHQIPCSKGPYLATFRRKVEFTPETGKGRRDKRGYQAMLAYIAALEEADQRDARLLVVYLLYRFVLLREHADVAVSRAGRLSLEQYGT